MNLGLVNVVVVPFVWTSDEHDDKIFSVVEGVIADWRLEQVSVLLEPLGDVDWW